MFGVYDHCLEHKTKFPHVTNVISFLIEMQNKISLQHTFDCLETIKVKRERQIPFNLHQITRFFINMYETEHSLKELPKEVIGI